MRRSDHAGITKARQSLADRFPAFAIVPCDKEVAVFRSGIKEASSESRLSQGHDRPVSKIGSFDSGGQIRADHLPIVSLIGRSKHMIRAAINRLRIMN